MLIIQLIPVFKIVWNYVIIFLKKIFGEKRLAKSVKLLPLDIKPINSIQKYPHINESYACILKIFVTRVDLSIDFLISLGTSSAPKLSKQVTLLLNTKQSNEFKYQNTHQDLLHMQHPLFYHADYL